MNKPLLTLILLLSVALTVSGCLQRPEVISTDHRWGEVTSEETELVSTIVVDGPNFVPIPLSDVKVDIYMNGIHMGTGSAVGDTTISGRDEIEISSRIENERLRDWWLTHIRNGEETEVKIRGTLVFGVLGYGLEVPVENNVRFNTSILSKMSSKEVRMGFTGFDALVMKNMEFKWDVEKESDTAIIVTMDVRNNLPVKIPLRSIDYQMKMNGVKIAQGASSDHRSIPASGQREIRMEMTMDNSKIPQWWVTHIQKGERTAVSIDMQLTLEMDGKEETVELSDMEFEFSTNIAGSMS
ncbi:MAG: LEA type 2 family protein [Archaeoglobaceae archaeon]